MVGRTVPPGAPYMHVFQLMTVATWYRRSWRTTLKATVDGAVYALFTGVVFASMWPR